MWDWSTSSRMTQVGAQTYRAATLSHSSNHTRKQSVYRHKYNKDTGMHYSPTAWFSHIPMHLPSIYCSIRNHLLGMKPQFFCKTSNLSSNTPRKDCQPDFIINKSKQELLQARNENTASFLMSNSNFAGLSACKEGKCSKDVKTPAYLHKLKLEFTNVLQSQTHIHLCGLTKKNIIYQTLRMVYANYGGFRGKQCHSSLLFSYYSHYLR